MGLEIGSSKQFGSQSWSTHRTAQTLHFGTHTSDVDTTTIIARSSTRGTSQRKFFRSVCLLHVLSFQTTSCIEKRRVPEDCGTSVGLGGWLFAVYCQCIATAGARREHVAGKRLKEIMEQHHMRSTSAELGGATWFGDTVSSNDRLCLGSSCTPSPMLWSTPKNGCIIAVDWHATIARPRPTEPGV